MDVDLFGKIVAKATAEHQGQHLAFDLFNWGEPLLHPNIDAIIGLVNEAGHEVRLSTNLNQDRFLEKAVRANPKLIKISLSGYYQNMYGVTHRKGDINVVKSNMYKLRSLIDKHGVDTEVMIGYHLYRNNLGDDYDKMESLARELMFVFYTDYANLMPAENIIKCLSGDPLSSEDASLTLGRLLVQPKEIKEELQDHNRKMKERDCILRSGFTTINYDGSVALCCAIYDELYNISNSYLDVPFDILRNIKYSHKYCETCMENGADLLLSYSYPESVKALKKSRFEEIRTRHKKI